MGMALLLLIRKYIQCSNLYMIMADVLSGRTSNKVNRKVQEELQAEVAATPWH